MNKTEKVNKLLLACLNEKEEGALVVDGIVRKFGFSQEKINQHREEIRELLADMPDAFQKNSGGGMSFLNLCMDKHGDQWAEHPTMEALVALGIAAGMASYSLPRQMWSILPGGVPYVTFDMSVS
jgi:hypothetical protein